MTNDDNLALALSGGGIRAMVFHLGVLQFLAEKNALERVSHISTVSGGSLIIGLLLKETQMQWPTSAQYLEFVLPSLQEKLCTRSLMGGMIRQLRFPQNWYYLLSRANLLAFALRDEWGITEKLSELPIIPEWSINGTTAETGKRFRFKQKNLGEYTLGYASSKNFPLSNALAVSAAFPGGIGPLLVFTEGYEWKKREIWDNPIETETVIKLPYSHLHLYDGGVYDNLGLEPFFDVGKGIVKKNLPSQTKIIVSDASAPLEQGFSLSRLNPWRIKRVTDIISDQSRALRIRTFINHIQKNPNKGAFIYIGSKISKKSICDSAKFASTFPTTLCKLTKLEFEKILNHGYQVSKKIYVQKEYL